MKGFAKVCPYFKKLFYGKMNKLLTFFIVFSIPHKMFPKMDDYETKLKHIWNLTCKRL